MVQMRVFKPKFYFILFFHLIVSCYSRSVDRGLIQASNPATLCRYSNGVTSSNSPDVCICTIRKSVTILGFFYPAVWICDSELTNNLKTDWPSVTSTKHALWVDSCDTGTEVLANYREYVPSSSSSSTMVSYDCVAPSVYVAGYYNSGAQTVGQDIKTSCDTHPGFVILDGGKWRQQVSRAVVL